MQRHEEPEVGQRGGDVGVDDTAMGQDGRLQAEECDGEHGGARPPMSPREGEDERAQTERQQHRGHARPEAEVVQTPRVHPPELFELAEEVLVVVRALSDGR